MASVTQAFKVRKRLKIKGAGKKRKIKLARHGTTPTLAVFFGDEKQADK